MRTSTTLVCAAIAALGAMGACSSEDKSSGSGTNSATTGTPTSTTMGMGGTTSTTSTNTNNATSTTSVTTRTCELAAGTEQSLEAEVAGIPGSIATYSYGDGVTTACLESGGTPNNVCLYGLGADSDNGTDNQYAYWGSGIGVQLADAEEDGTINAPWDAAALGIAGLRYTISGASTVAPVRMGIVLVDTEEVEYQVQGFVQGDDAENDVTADGTYTVMFSEMFLPSWTPYLDAPADLLNFDETNIHSLQFQVVTEPGETSPYDFCILDITWLDADGMPVDVPVPMPMNGEGGAGGQGGQAGE